MRARHFIVRGRVQGVGFRWFTARAANDHDVTGFVRNLPDGTVEIHAQADAENLELFKHVIEQGPSSSHVTEVVERTAAVSPTHTHFMIT